jgi:hypothetical protein
VSNESIRLAAQRKLDARALRKAISHQSGRKPPTFSPHASIHAVLISRPSLKVLLEARLAPGEIWRGTAYVTSGNPVAGALTLACLLKCDEK